MMMMMKVCSSGEQEQKQDKRAVRFSHPILGTVHGYWW